MHVPAKLVGHSEYDSHVFSPKMLNWLHELIHWQAEQQKVEFFAQTKKQTHSIQRKHISVRRKRDFVHMRFCQHC